MRQSVPEKFEDERICIRASYPCTKNRHRIAFKRINGFGITQLAGVRDRGAIPPLQICSFAAKLCTAAPIDARC